jgi:hypothetical protein
MGYTHYSTLVTHQIHVCYYGCGRSFIMATIPKWTIEIDEVDAGATYKTQVVRGATAVSDGTELTVPLGTTATGRLHEALLKGITAAINDRAAGN